MGLHSAPLRSPTLHCPRIYFTSFLCASPTPLYPLHHLTIRVAPFQPSSYLIDVIASLTALVPLRLDYIKGTGPNTYHSEFSQKPLKNPCSRTLNKPVEMTITP